MKSQIEKLKDWVEVPADEDSDFVEGTVVENGFMTRQALFSTTEWDAPEDSRVIVAACLYTHYVGMTPEMALTTIANEVGTSLAVPSLALAVPGMCGHYQCGGAVIICLN
jgi:hypothetical protein